MIAASNEMNPAAYAAAISPLECPTTAVGLTPADESLLKRATWMAVQSGWAISALSTLLVAAGFSSSSGDVSHVSYRSRLVHVRELPKSESCLYIPIIFHSGGFFTRLSTSSILSRSLLNDGSDMANSLPIPARKRLLSAHSLLPTGATQRLWSLRHDLD